MSHYQNISKKVFELKINVGYPEVVRTKVTGPSKESCGVWICTVIVMDDPWVKVIGVGGSMEINEKPGVETETLLIESGDAGDAMVNLKEYQNSCPWVNESIPLGWLLKLSVCKLVQNILVGACVDEL